MADLNLPRMARVKQVFPARKPLDLPQAVAAELDPVIAGLKPGARIAVAVGSRGITHIQTIVQSAVRRLQSVGASPFIVPAMGSHGGGTPDGQIGVLREYGISESTLQVPIHAGMDVETIGRTDDGIPVYFSREALQSDGVLIINRVKPHTDFQGDIGSGLLKMLVVGLGKQRGAAHFHANAIRIGYEPVIRTMARTILRSAPILAGLAILESEAHEPAKIALVQPGEMERREEALFIEAREMMPRIPFSAVDLLIVDRLGKNISGSGMDPNIIGRSVHGSGSAPKSRFDPPRIHRIFVRDLTPETHGNAVGIGLADFTTTRLVDGINREITYMNALTALTPQSIKIPPHFKDDREAAVHALRSLGLTDFGSARIVRIQDTLNLTEFHVSEALLDAVRENPNLCLLSSPVETFAES